jgi:cytochrome c oxidase cbb3-type subunit III
MKNLIPSYIRVPVLFFIIFGLIEYLIDSGEKPAFIEYPIIMLFLVLVLIILIAIEAIVGALENVMLQNLDADAKARYFEEKEKGFEFKLLIYIYKKLTKSKPIDSEGEIIIDHDYDGIKKLDNALPPWWKYAFYITIIFAIVYLVRFEILDGKNQIEEYETEVTEAKTTIEEPKKTAKDLVDENTVELLTDASDLSAGKTIYELNCVACHMPDGGGGIGPNLTDKNWILGGGIKNVFKVVSDGGRDGKGMIPWKQILNPAEIAQVSSYILQFQGTTPANPKAAEGDIIWGNETEVTEAKTTIEEPKKTTKDLVNVNTVELLTDASDLSAGKTIYELNCVACHMPDGGGGIGPNLTDKNWILGGGIKNVFKVVSDGGRDGKGMIPWKQILNPAEIAQVSSYILQFQGTTPANPKAAEGEVWNDKD